jgi:hypothetical protein
MTIELGLRRFYLLPSFAQLGGDEPPPSGMKRKIHWVGKKEAGEQGQQSGQKGGGESSKKKKDTRNYRDLSSITLGEVSDAYNYYAKQLVPSPFPTWLAPVQVAVLPVADRHDAYAQEVADRLRGAGVRVEYDDAHTEKLGKRIFRAKSDKIPYVLVVGDDDVAAGTVGVNRRGSEQPERGVSLDAFLAELQPELAPSR